MQGYLSRTLYVSRSEQFSENEVHGKLGCGLWETVSTIVFIIVYIILQILFEAHAHNFKKLGNITRIFHSFSWGIFSISHMTRLDQSPRGKYLMDYKKEYSLPRGKL